MGFGIGHKMGLQKFRLASLLNQIPTSADALFWLDGVIVEDGGNKYFRDKTGNDRKFLITDYDFDSTWVAGMPYKSAATISAPAADATLIAADINNYLYDSGGTPNQIPVVSLFQDIDYEHKLFCRHYTQVVDGNGVETDEARVLDIVLYANVKTGTDLTACQTYYGVPVEDVETMVWIAADGNDTTGDGSKTNPYLTIDKVKSTTASVIYIKSGKYTITSDPILTGNSVAIKGVGFSEIEIAGSTQLTFNRIVSSSNIIFTATTTANLGIRIRHNISFDKCKLYKASGNCFMQSSYEAGQNVTVNNSIASMSGTTYGLLYSQSYSYGDVIYNGLYGVAKLTMSATRKSTSLQISHCKLSENLGALYSNSLLLFNNIISGTSTLYPTANTTTSYNDFGGNVTVTVQDNYVFSNNTVNGLFSSNVANGFNFKNNKITASDNTRGLQLQATIGGAFTNVVISGNEINGNTATEVVFIGTPPTIADSGYVHAKFINNVIRNTTTSTPTNEGVYLYGDFEITGNIIYGCDLYCRIMSNTYISGNYVNASYYVKTHDRQALNARAAAGAGIDGTIIENNTFIGSSQSLPITYAGGNSITGIGDVVNLKFQNNKVVNDTTLTGFASAHTTTFGGGINFMIRWNKVIYRNGYALVIKAEGEHYTTNDGHISYNLFIKDGEDDASYAIFCRGAYGVNFVNNVILNHKGYSLVNSDQDDNALLDSLLNVYNNLFLLGGDIDSYKSGDLFLDMHDNYINTNGYTVDGSIDEDDFVTTVEIDNNGVPSVSIEGGVIISGDNNVGLDVTTEIPESPVYKNQGANWQVGAYVI